MLTGAFRFNEPSCPFVAAVNGDVGSPGVIVNQPCFTALNQNRTGLALTFFTQPGLTNRVEYKNSLSDPAWTLLTEVPAATNPLTITDPASLTNASRYYRVRLQP